MEGRGTPKKEDEIRQLDDVKRATSKRIETVADDLGFLNAALDKALEHLTQPADVNSEDLEKLQKELDELHNKIQATNNRVKNLFPESKPQTTDRNEDQGGKEERTKEETIHAILAQFDAVKRAIRDLSRFDPQKQKDPSQFDFNKHIENIEDGLGFLKATLEDALFPMGKKLECLTRQADTNSKDGTKLKNNLDHLLKEIEATKKRVKRSFPDHYKRASEFRSRDDKKRDTTSKDQTTSTPEWQEKLEEKILESSAPAHLQASYDSLELQFKLCFLCLAAFPENQEVKKRVLIYWWIGEGLVSPKGEKSAEEMGEECFQKLLDLGLIEPIYAKATNIVHRCKVHPWFRWMLVAIAKEATFFDLNSRGGPDVGHPTYKSRRACLVKSKQPFSPSPIDEDLISLVNIDQNVIILKSEELSKLRKLVVLQLGRWQTSVRHHIEGDTDLLKGLESLRHLRYLSLRGISRITNLPDSISQLGDLRILDLHACHNLEKLTSGITSLKKLTHLDVTECYLLDQLPKGMGSLSDLQVLKGFVFASSTSKDACKFTELTKLEKLRKLSLNTGNIDTHGNEYLNHLTNFKNLRSLTISWGIVAPAKDPSAAQQMSKKQSLAKKPTGIPPFSTKPAPPPSSTKPALPNLEKLDLRCFPESETPDLLTKGEFDKLKNLYIRGGQLRNLKLPASKLLEVLRLKFLLYLESDWTDLKEKLPHLKRAEIVECPRMKSCPPLIDDVWVNNAA